MVTAERLAARREAMAQSTDLDSLFSHVMARNVRVARERPVVPEVKALLSVDGGRCPSDGSTLVFDPWNGEEHVCRACGARVRGERHTRAWAKFQHLWLVERAAELATLAALRDPALAPPAAELLQGYGERYFRFPNRDNVLGPSRLFFSTYLESIWVLNYLAAATLLRESGLLDDVTARAVHTVADEAANLIGEYDEGFSNRQTWNNAALCAIAVWFEDEDLARRAIEGHTGLLAHLRGYRDDGLWYEGENYHLFALRGLLTGAGWAAEAGVDLFSEPEMAERIALALRAPALTALPDYTFPARKDSRFGLSLAQPVFLELWEVGLGRLGRGEWGAVGSDRDLIPWLHALYGSGPVQPELFESYLHEAPLDTSPLPAAHSRRQLSWWSLLEMPPALPESGEPWVPRSIFLSGQGLAVVRAAGRYVGLECGGTGGGHGHPDRLNLLVHSDGVYWLPDAGTGSYVARDLRWYRSTLAHNAPRLDGVSQRPGEASGEGFDEQAGWGWARGRFGPVTRTVVTGPAYVLDLVELTGREERVIEVPFHFAGRGEIVTPGRWEEAELTDGEFVSGVERFRPAAEGPLVLVLEADRRPLTAYFLIDGELLRADGPDGVFYVLRARGRNSRLTSVLQFGLPDQGVRDVRTRGELIEVETEAGTDRHRFGGREWEVVGQDGTVTLAAFSQARDRVEPLLDLEPPTRPSGTAWRVDAPPALDGTTAGFDLTEPLQLDLEDQYRRSDEAYAGPQEFSATCAVNWDDDALYLAVQVRKPDLCIRSRDASPLLLDNEPDDIHSDGLQVYLGREDGEPAPTHGFLVVPESDGSGLRIRRADGAVGDPAMVRGGWRQTADGYVVTLAINWPEQLVTHVGGRVGFDLIVNEMLPGRERRAGQLVWSGGDGWVWLQGDRQDPARFGVLELVG
jgi:hypothetical protein